MHLWFKAGLCLGILNSLYAEEAPEADRLFAEGLYTDAATHYEKSVLTDQTILKLAACYLEMGDPDKAANLLAQSHSQKDPEWLLLMSQTDRHLSRFQPIVDRLNEWNGMGALAVEKGIALYHLHQPEAAHPYFDRIAWDERSPTSYYLAQLYLIRIALDNNNTDQIRTSLSHLNEKMEPDHPLAYEKNELEGRWAYLNQDYDKAAHHFEKALPKNSLNRCPWAVNTLTCLGYCYLNQAATTSDPLLFTKGEATFKRLIALENKESHWFLLTDLLFLKKDPEAYRQAVTILFDPHVIVSTEGQQIALLKLAQAAPTYQERKSHYIKLTERLDPSAPLFTESWFQRGMNDFKEAHYDEAADAFEKAHQSSSSPQAALARRYQALSYYQQQNKETLLQAIQLLISDKLENDEEIILLGKIYMKLGQVDKADEILAQAKGSEAILLRGQMAQGEKRKEFLSQLFDDHPDSPYAPAAYFHYYAARDYMRGHRQAIKHLQAMPTQYPNHPLLISAYYLIGLDHKKDHLSEEGKILRPKDWMKAIDAFQLAESSFDKLEGTIPEEDHFYFIQVRYQAMLERGLAHLAIAKQSEGGKRAIYLEYAEEVFKKLKTKFNHPDDNYPKVLEEADYGLVQVYQAKGDRDEADRLLNQMIARYKQANVQQSYRLSRVWYDKGMIQQNPQESLEDFIQSEAASGNSLSPDEKLDLWIQQSLCYKELKHYSAAMRLLSKAVNDESISPLRIKAMYLRAEIYELEGRKELALKQLEATSKKGGEWGKIAKIKLKKELK